MPLQADTRLGHYQILAPLGAGGMGEVYRARDTRLGREVAVKVLPAALSGDSERLSRFEREARAASSLNHPNIVTIYDIGTSDSASYIAMEIVRGVSLRELLTDGPVAARKLLDIGAQIGEGLAKAHAAGIVHRDLKPENVMVTDDGLVKILDFGLAKLAEPDSGANEATHAPTVSGATEPGIVMGTVGYMSPEQTLAKAVDFRSDQFALGAILYELSTGRRAFARESVPQTMAAIIQEEPEPIVARNPAIPAPLRWIVERCLAKEPRGRYASTEDLARDLATVRDHLSEATSSVAVPAALAEPVRPRSRVAAAIATALLLALGLAVWRMASRDFFWKNPLAGAKFTRLTDWEGSELDAAISRDGRFVAFLSDRDGPFELWVTQVGSGEFLNLSRGRFPALYIEDVRTVAFADDDLHVRVRVGPSSPTLAFASATWLVPTIGGSPRPFLAAGAIEVGWSPDRARTVYHLPGPGDPIFVADRKGSNEVEISKGKAGIHQHYPIWSPEGRYIYFVRGIPATFEMDVYRVPASGGIPERLTDDHARSAYLAFLDERTLLYTATRPDREGSGLYAMDVRNRIPHAVSFGLEEYLSIDASADGRRVVATVARPDRNIWAAPISERVADDAEVHRYRIPPVRATAPRYGRDYILYLSPRDGPDGLWKFRDGVETELWRGRDGAVAAAPAVSADGSRIAFSVRIPGRGSLQTMGSDGTSPRRLAETLDVRDAPSWSPDGKWIVVAASEGGEDQPLFLVPVDGGRPERLVGGIAHSPVWSPDGRFIVYAEGRQGRSWQLKAVTPDRRPFPLPDLWVPFNRNPQRFLPDGRSLVVMRGEARQQNFWRVDLASGALTQLTDLKPGFETRSFDISPDGKTILFDRYRENADVVLIDMPPR